MIKYKSFYYLASWTNISLNSIIKTTINRELDMDTNFNLMKDIDFSKLQVTLHLFSTKLNTFPFHRIQ